MANVPIDPLAFSDKDISRFWRHIDVQGENECWNWLKSGASHGYGMFNFGGRATVKKLRAHRVAYSLASGEFPPEMVVRHICDNPKCCNPKHLELGTKAENSADMVQRGRSYKQPGRRLAKLNAQDVVNLRRRAKTGETVLSLATEYGIHERTARYAIMGKTWKSVNTLEEPRVWRP
ncbi:endonuclease [Corynebacterium phage phi674]|uniref:Putative HNH endonuclease n=1 Tax=Corynebacterium phage phi674 TaxID=2052822 RepID=A0A2H4PJ04_9CAUD|nr:endonuclease [Corynebacterium phage phi674]ATW62961.1 putative HNH endonuclease [Corynebacterium phage phi674]